MENNNAQWVDERLASLEPTHFHPDTERAFARLGGAPRSRVGLAKWAIPLAAASAAVLLAFPAPRAVAQRCVDACANLFVSTPQAAPAIGVPVPDLSLTDASGAGFRLSEYRGKVVLLNFWATWCPPCVAEMPLLSGLESSHAARGFAVIGVSLDEQGWTNVRPFLDKHRPGYRIALGGDEAAGTYGVEKLPETFLIGREGQILARWAGAIEKETVERELAKALAR